MACDVHRKLWIFDFDDTLVRTGSLVYLSRAGGAQLALTPAQFALHDRAADDVFDFRDFQRLIDPKPIENIDRVLRKAYNDHGPGTIVILSARTFPEPIEEYMMLAGVPGTTIVALASADPAAKAAWVDRRLRSGELDEVQFFDDSWKNVAAVREVTSRYPHVMTTIHHVVDQMI